MVSVLPATQYAYSVSAPLTVVTNVFSAVVYVPLAPVESFSYASKEMCPMPPD